MKIVNNQHENHQGQAGRGRRFRGLSMKEAVQHLREQGWD